ncbi:hypothetical protein FRC01_013664, partial [Tulasnella sp. 417]
MGILFLLATRSPSFWTVMERMAPILKGRIESETVYAHDIPSTTQATHPGPGGGAAKYSPPFAKTAKPGDRFMTNPNTESSGGFDADDDDATSGAELAVPTRSTRMTEQPEDLHDMISRNWSEITIKTRNWMKSVTQWHHVFEDIHQGQKKLGILSTRLAIDVTVTPVPPSPTQQAPLTDTIRSAFPESDTKEMLDVLRSNAASLCLKGAGEDLLQMLANQALTYEELEERWVSGFRGDIHCEAQLAYNIFQNRPS